MPLRQVMNYIDDGVLRKKSKTVDKIDKKILMLIEDMVETICSSNCV